MDDLLKQYLSELDRQRKKFGNIEFDRARKELLQARESAAQELKRQQMLNEWARVAGQAAAQDQKQKQLAAMQWWQHMGFGLDPTAATAPAPVPYPVAKPLPKAFLVGPIIAYRAWNVNVRDVLLLSLNHGNFWPVGQPAEATCGCTKVHGSCPDSECSCGVYAWRSPKKLLEENGRSANRVLGQVALWGKIIEHKLGYRAQYAYPLALWVPRSPMPGFPMAPSAVTKIAEQYGIATAEAPDPKALEAA